MKSLSALLLAAAAAFAPMSGAVPAYPYFDSSCGCVDADDPAVASELVAWTLFRDAATAAPHLDTPVPLTPRAKCDQFCQGAPHFTLSPWSGGKRYSAAAAAAGQRSGAAQVLCECYKSLDVFDCDEEEEGEGLIEVHCRTEPKPRRLGGDNLVEDGEGFQRDVLASVRGGFKQLSETMQHNEERRELKSDDPKALGSNSPSENTLPTGNDSLEKELRDFSTVSSSEADLPEKKKEAFALLAVILGLLALVCLVALALKTWCDHKKEQRKAEVQVKIEQAARATTGSFAATRGAAGGGGGGQTNKTMQRVPSDDLFRTPRLLSLGAGPMVFEKE